ncbi:MAG: PAS domain-containing protein, partial [Promethearchaeota archaeon]
MEFSKDIFLNISESVNDLICILNSDLEIEYINEPVFKEILGYSNDDLLGKNIKAFIDVDEFKKLFKILDAIYKIKENSAIIRILDEEGNYNWFDGKVRRLPDKEQKRFLLILRDISEWKIAESTLRDSKEKYQSLVENIKEGYYEVDLKGDFTFVNDALCEFVGYSRGELIG